LKRFLGAVLALAFVAGAPCGAFAKSSPSPSPSPAASPTAEPAEVAIPRLEAKLKASPDDRDTLLQLSGYYLQIGRPDHALTTTQHLLQLGVKTGQVYYLDGLARQALGQGREALSDFEQASNLAPTDATILLRLSDLYLRANRNADAERVAKRALTFNKDDEQAIINYGIVLGQENRYDEARAQFNEATQKNPKDPVPLILSAKVYEAQKSLDYAVQMYDRALALDPKNTDAFTGKAGDLALENKIPQAIAVYDQMLANAPTDDDKVTILNQEAVTYARAGQRKPAEDLFDKMVATYPRSLLAHLDYGDYDLATNQPQKAESEWKTALSIQSKSADAMARLANLYLGTSHNADALGYLKQLTADNPSDPDLLFALGRAYSYGREYEHAREACGRAFNVTHAPPTLACVAASDFELKNYKEAARLFDLINKSASQYLTQNPEFIFIAGQSYDKNGQKSQAKAMYQKFLAFVKPNTDAEKQVKKLISDLNSK